MPEAVRAELPELTPLLPAAACFVEESLRGGAGQRYFALAAVVKAVEEVIDPLSQDLPPEDAALFASTLEVALRCQLLPPDDSYVKDFRERLSPEELGLLPRAGWIGALWSRSLSFHPPGRIDSLAVLARRWNAWLGQQGAAGFKKVLDRVARGHPEVSKYFRPGAAV